MLTRAALDVLRLAAEQDEEIVAEGAACWVGDHRTTSRTARQLLECLAISDVSDVKGIRRYVVNGAGRSILERPELAAEIVAAVYSGRNFTIQENRIVPI